ncbi:hypothetical protein AT864_02758 [Anoxybacillus sp. P3H1B]|nr:hypothetical protein AT864_02758 [Anoxybacillus sp. P3H1B]MBB3908663.1 hypothetical protein [Anoxybacillus rupiensis]
MAGRERLVQDAQTALCPRFIRCIKEKAVLYGKEQPSYFQIGCPHFSAKRF